MSERFGHKHAADLLADITDTMPNAKYGPKALTTFVILLGDLDAGGGSGRVVLAFAPGHVRSDAG